MSEPAIVRIFDTTLRDGEQSPGCTMSRDEKLALARQLARLQVDIIEAGFPAASRGDFDAVQAIAGEIGSADGPVICGLARANREDIDLCWRAIETAAKPRLHTFLATSDIHLTYKLRMTRAQVLDAVRTMVAFARERCDDVEFSPEDAGRSDPAFLHVVLTAAIEAGATTLNIPDTVGYVMPDEYGAMIDGIFAHVPGAHGVTISTHCHDDLGMAVANSLAGVRAGARQVECTINGIGERAGNASLEEIVMALHTRAQHFGAATYVQTTQLARTSRLLASIIGVSVPPNKAIVGANAFAHEAGIHQDGVLKNPMTYEIMRAETVGLDGNALVLGKHSGRHALRARLEGMGHLLSEDEFRHIFTRFKDIADRKKIVEERDLEALVVGEVRRPPPLFVLRHVQVSCGTELIPTATVRLVGPDGEVRTESAQGTGPVDAVCAAINRIVGDPGELVEFDVTAVTEGISAVGEVTMRVRERRAQESLHSTEAPDVHIADAERSERFPVYSGNGVHVDIVVAAAEAYLSALNRLFHAREMHKRPALDQREAFV
ncbi:MAG: 2-isopropylmalate synthase [Gemmatimonadaceae bacterium]